LFDEKICEYANFNFHQPQPAEFFFFKKIRQMKAGQNNKYDIYKDLSRSCAGLYINHKFSRFSTKIKLLILKESISTWGWVMILAVNKLESRHQASVVRGKSQRKKKFMSLCTMAKTKLL
jgi:hypothetical protein